MIVTEKVVILQGIMRIHTTIIVFFCAIFFCLAQMPERPSVAAGTQIDTIDIDSVIDSLRLAIEAHNKAVDDSVRAAEKRLRSTSGVHRYGLYGVLCQYEESLSLWSG